MYIDRLQTANYLKVGEVVRPLCDAVSSDHAVELCLKTTQIREISALLAGEGTTNR